MVGTVAVVAAALASDWSGLVDPIIVVTVVTGSVAAGGAGAVP